MDKTINRVIYRVSGLLGLLDSPGVVKTLCPQYLWSFLEHVLLASPVGCSGGGRELISQHGHRMDHHPDSGTRNTKAQKTHSKLPTASGSGFLPCEL